MKYVITGGYIYSGASIPHDLLKECTGIKTFKEEFKLLTLTDGILDLERVLFDHPIYYKTGIALKRFEDLCKRLFQNKNRIYSYKEVFSQDFDKYIGIFLNDIAPKKYDCGTSMWLLEEWQKIFGIDKHGYSIETRKRYGNKQEIKFCDIDRNFFFVSVRKLLDAIFAEYAISNIDTCVLDQGLYPQFADKMTDYFPDGKMIVVDRDPRDIATSIIDNNKILGIYLQKNLDADFYVAWFKQHRRLIERVSSDMVMYTRYEEWAYEFEKTKHAFFDFVDIDESRHVNAGKYVNPKRSASKVGRWKEWNNEKYFTRKEWLAFCEKVEKELKEYCVC